MLGVAAAPAVIQFVLMLLYRCVQWTRRGVQARREDMEQLRGPEGRSANVFFWGESDADVFENYDSHLWGSNHFEWDACKVFLIV